MLTNPDAYRICSQSTRSPLLRFLRKTIYNPYLFIENSNLKRSQKAHSPSLNTQHDTRQTSSFGPRPQILRNSRNQFFCNIFSQKFQFDFLSIRFSVKTQKETQKSFRQTTWREWFRKNWDFQAVFDFCHKSQILSIKDFLKISEIQNNYFCGSKARSSRLTRFLPTKFWTQNRSERFRVTSERIAPPLLLLFVGCKFKRFPLEPRSCFLVCQICTLESSR